jgi:hypothetical protein
LSAVRLTREHRERGYAGAYTAVKRFAAAIRPDNAPKPFEMRFETPAGKQAQVDFARFVTVFTDEPGVTRIIWLFSMVLGHSRFIFALRGSATDLPVLRRIPDFGTASRRQGKAHVPCFNCDLPDPLEPDTVTRWFKSELQPPK